MRFMDLGYKIEKGIYLISPPVITQDNFAKVAFCIGPGGVYFEFVEIL